MSRTLSCFTNVLCFWNTHLDCVSFYVFNSEVTRQKKYCSFLQNRLFFFHWKSSNAKFYTIFYTSEIFNLQPQLNEQPILMWLATLILKKWNYWSRIQRIGIILRNLNCCSLPNDRFVFAKRCLVNSVTKIKAWSRSQQLEISFMDRLIKVFFAQI